MNISIITKDHDAAKAESDEFPDARDLVVDLTKIVVTDSDGDEQTYELKDLVELYADA